MLLNAVSQKNFRLACFPSKIVSPFDFFIRVVSLWNESCWERQRLVAAGCGLREAREDGLCVGPKSVAAELLLDLFPLGQAQLLDYMNLFLRRLM